MLDPFDVSGEQVKVTGTIGISFGPVPGDDQGLLYRQAEMALTCDDWRE